VDYQTPVLSAAGLVGPIILACGAFFSRKRIYAEWAKTVYIIAIPAGFVWGILGFIVWRPVHVSPEMWIFLLHIKDCCGGIVAGLVISVLMARPYEERVSADSEESRTTPGLTNR
jgi:hypothetical protein